jgi:hypothetical protein
VWVTTSKIGHIDGIQHIIDLAGLSGHEEHPRCGYTPGLALDLAIMRQRPEIRAIAVGPARLAPALDPGSDPTWEDAAFVDPDDYARLPIAAHDVAATIGRASVIRVPGIAVIALGSDSFEALWGLDVLAGVARTMAVASDGTTGPSSTTAPRHSHLRPRAQRRPAPPADLGRYYRSLDPGARSPVDGEATQLRFARP